MKAIIVSHKFNPGHFSHLIANYKLFKDCGFSPCLFINKSFNRMDKKNEFNKINTSSELKKLKTVDIAVFWFPSLRNIIGILRLRILFKSKIIYIYHEPFDSIRNYYNSGFRFKKILKICFVNVVNIPVILLSHCIVLPSKAALTLYQKKYTYLNHNYSLIPLLFDDEAESSLGIFPKKYISYIGTIAADHAFNKFVNFVESCLINGWFSDMTFLIATSSKIPPKEKKRLEQYIKSRVVISEGHPMTNEEINLYYRDSQVVWNAYNRSMQSGVLPKAYMFGAAVIALIQIASDFVDDHKTGVLIKNNNDIIEIKNAVQEILHQKDVFSQNCRKKFLDTFYYKKYINNFKSLLDKSVDKGEYI